MTDNFDFSQHDASISAMDDHDMLNLTHDSDDIMLPDEMVLNAVTKACDFFKIPVVDVYNAPSTRVEIHDTDTYDDDILGFNREQLMKLGIKGEDSLTLIYTHECSHRALQSSNLDRWENELASDFFAGVNAGMNDINIDNFEAALGQTAGSDTHPTGALRADFIEYGKQIANEMIDRGVEPTFEGCFARFNEHLNEKEGLISEYRERVDIKNINTTEASSSNKIEDFVNDAAWHMKAAADAQSRGDLSSAADHLSSAKICSR